MMKIIDVFWTESTNMAVIECPCGNKFGHPFNRWYVMCKRCGQKAKIDKLREEFARRTHTNG